MQVYTKEINNLVITPSTGQKHMMWIWFYMCRKITVQALKILSSYKAKKKRKKKRKAWKYLISFMVQDNTIFYNYNYNICFIGMIFLVTLWFSLQCFNRSVWGCATSLPLAFCVLTWCGWGTAGPPKELILSSSLLWAWTSSGVTIKA